MAPKPSTSNTSRWKPVRAPRPQVTKLVEESMPWVRKRVSRSSSMVRTSATVGRRVRGRRGRRCHRRAAARPAAESATRQVEAVDADSGGVCVRARERARVRSSVVLPDCGPPMMAACPPAAVRSRTSGPATASRVVDDADRGDARAGAGREVESTLGGSRGGRCLVQGEARKRGEPDCGTGVAAGRPGRRTRRARWGRSAFGRVVLVVLLLVLGRELSRSGCWYGVTRYGRTAGPSLAFSS